MLANKLQDYIVSNYLDGDSDGLDADTQLLALNIIDSVSIFDLVNFIRQQSNCSIPMVEIKPDNFASINAMCALVERLGE